jgi:hypothetical protein
MAINFLRGAAIGTGMVALLLAPAVIVSFAVADSVLSPREEARSVPPADSDVARINPAAGKAGILGLYLDVIGIQSQRMKDPLDPDSSL